MWRSPLGQQQFRKESHGSIVAGTPALVKLGSLLAVKKLLLLAVLVVLGVALYRRFSGDDGAPQHLHGTPDHWPAVVRKPGSESAPAA